MVVFLQWRARLVSRSSQYRCLVASTTRMRNNLSTSVLDNNASSNEQIMECKKSFEIDKKINVMIQMKLIKRSIWWSKCRSNIDQSYLIKYASWEIFPILASQPLCPPWPLDIIVPSDSLSPPLIRHWRVPATLPDPNSFYYPNPTQCIFQNIRV